MSVPIFKDLSFYNDANSSTARYQALQTSFNKVYGNEPEFVGRSPGRVNLIGDHIDYCYFSVLPMALDVDVIAATSVNDSNTIRLANTNDKFPSYEFEISPTFEISQADYTWVNYFKCGLIVANNYLKELNPSTKLKGMNLLFDGNVPTGGGLSSSAAICVTSALVVLRANGLTNISKEDLTRITVVSEHYVGVNTGGMDQCASIYGEKGKALLIQFKPKLIGIPFELPTTKPHELVFLVSNSLVESNKHETAPTNYNLRVVEVALAAEWLAKKLKLSLVNDSNLETGTLRGFLDSYFELLGEPRWDGHDIDVGINRLTKCLELIEKPEIFNQEEQKGVETEHASNCLELLTDQFYQRFLSKFPVKYDKLKLYQRSKHVFSDSLRVLEFLKIFEEQKLKPSTGILQDLGKLLNESQQSCNLLNNASKPDCEELCQIARENGSYGSRITGAGFGGSIVHLTTVDRLESLVEALKKEYYLQKFPNITQDQLNEAIVVSKPATGSCILEL